MFHFSRRVEEMTEQNPLRVSDAAASQNTSCSLLSRPLEGAAVPRHNTHVDIQEVKPQSKSTSTKV